MKTVRLFLNEIGGAMINLITTIFVIVYNKNGKRRQLMLLMYKGIFYDRTIFTGFI